MIVNRMMKIAACLVVGSAGIYVFGPDAVADNARCHLIHEDMSSVCMRAEGWRKNRSGKGWHWLIDTSLPAAPKPEFKLGPPVDYVPDFSGEPGSTPENPLPAGAQ